MGDVIMVRRASNPQSISPRRVIGLPGDRVAIINNVVRINARDVSRERLPDWHGESVAGRDTVFEEDRETLPNGRSYEVIVDHQNESPALKTMAEQTVAPGHLFVLGDNRMNSLDSRIPSYGDPTFADVIGVVVTNDVDIQGIFTELMHNVEEHRSQTGL